MSFFSEIYQFLFVSSVIYILNVLGNLGIKTYGRFVTKNEIRFQLTIKEKLMLWASIAIFFTYII